MLDLDETLIEGTLAERIVKRLVFTRKLPLRYYLKSLRYIHLLPMSKIRKIYRVYRYVLHKVYGLYRELISGPYRDTVFKTAAEVARTVDIPHQSIEFIKKLKEKGYFVVIVTASPQEIAEIVGRRLGADMVIGSSDRVLDREAKEEVVKRLKKEGSVEIIVGNKGNEPFWMSEKLSIIVNSPKDLIHWIDKI